MLDRRAGRARRRPRHALRRRVAAIDDAVDRGEAVLDAARLLGIDLAAVDRTLDDPPGRILRAWDRRDGAHQGTALQDHTRRWRHRWPVAVDDQPEATTGSPPDGPAILCPNHISFLDSAFLMLTVPRRISFVGKAEYMDSWKTKFLFPALGMIPIDRKGGRASMTALDAAEAVLRRGELFGIFPEGTRSRDGHLYKGHTGAARLALKVGCPIFPIGIVGTDKIQPPDAKMPKLRQECRITIGRPVPSSATRTGPTTASSSARSSTR